jgi:hypothetical protein
MAKPKAKYLNGFRRELVLWILSLQLILENHREHFKDKELTWLDSIILSIESLSKLMLGGLDATELKTIENAVKRIEPKLYAEKLVNQQNPTVKVNIDLLYDLAELALENCHTCKGDFDNCPHRKLFLSLLIPPYTEVGPCQYWRGEANGEI